MKGLAAGLKVGFLSLVILVVGFWMWQSIGERASGSGGYGLWARFKDAQGLAGKSRVVIAGLTIGEITDRRLEGRFARVSVKVRKGTEIWSNSVIFKKSSSLLGEYYLEIDPGSPESVAADGTIKKNRLLEPGEEIENVVEATSTDEIMRQVGQTLPRVDRALEEMEGLIVDVRKIVNTQVASIATTVDDALKEDTVLLHSILDRADKTLGNVQLIVSDVRKVTGNADERFDRILDNLEATTAEAKLLMSEARKELGDTSKSVQEKLDKLDKTLDYLSETVENSASISKKIDEDEGTLGKLVNDPTVYDNVADITTSAKGFTDSLFGLQTIVGLRGEYNFWGRNYRAYVSVELRTRPDKFYLFEVVGDPKGDLQETLVYDEAMNTFDRSFVVDYGYRFTFQFGKRYDWLGLRIGLKESTGGVGADAHLFGDKLKLSLDAFDFTYYKVPRVKFWGAYKVFRYMYLYAGADDVLNQHKEVDITGDVITGGEYKQWSFGLDFFAGTMLEFNDQDLSALLFVGGSALGSLSQ